MIFWAIRKLSSLLDKGLQLWPAGEEVLTFLQVTPHICCVRKSNIFISCPRMNFEGIVPRFVTGTLGEEVDLAMSPTKK